MGRSPEDEAREVIDSLLEKAGWHICDYKNANIHAGTGVVIRNFPLKPGHGTADYLFYIEAAIETSLKRAERLRQGILRKAFSGQLLYKPHFVGEGATEI